MIRNTLLIALTVVMPIFLCSCSEKGLEMDYGKPEAQFIDSEIAAKGQPFVGKKITIKGTVTKIDTSSPDAAWVHMEHGIKCNFGGMTDMAKSNSIGATVYVDGFLKQCDENSVVVEPAMYRDPTAPFSPQ